METITGLSRAAVDGILCSHRRCKKNCTKCAEEDKSHQVHRHCLGARHRLLQSSILRDQRRRNYCKCSRLSAALQVSQADQPWLPSHLQTYHLFQARRMSHNMFTTGGSMKRSRIVVSSGTTGKSASGGTGTNGAAGTGATDGTGQIGTEEPGTNLTNRITMPGNSITIISNVAMNCLRSI